MTTLDGKERLDDPAPPEVEARVPAFGAATPVVAVVGIFIVAVTSWWLLGDVEWSVTGAYAPVVNCLLFWTILGFIFTGFTFGNWPFSTLPQPLAGLAQVAVNVAIGVAATLLFTRVVGDWDPTFSSSTAGGAGYTATAFIVLIGFYAFTLASANWGGYPFEGVEGPVGGVAQFFLAAFITTVGTVVLVYPNFNAQLAATAPVGLLDALGWVYSSIVICIVAAMQWQNWPWAGIANRHLRALAALAVTTTGGYGLMLCLAQVAEAIVPATVTSAATFSANAEAAQIGVCISLCSLIGGLLFGPSKIGSVAAARAIRTVAVVVAALFVYVIFTRFFATTVLHFPAVSGRYGGDALAFIDWMILIVLWHAVAFGGHLTTRAGGRRGH